MIDSYVKMNRSYKGINRNKWALESKFFVLIFKSIYAYAHPADPVNSLRQSRSATKLSRPLCRFYKVPIPWGDPWEGPRGPKGDPKGTQGDPKGPKGTKGNQGTQRAQRDPRGIKGTQGDPRGPKGAFGALGGMGPWGPLGLFRSHSEWKAISSRGLL